MGHDQQHIKDRTQHAHAHHGLARALEREHECDQQTGHQRGTPHDRDGVSRQCAHNDAAALEVSDHPAVDALLCSVLEEQKAGQHPEPCRTQKAPVNGLLFLGILGPAAAQRGKGIYQPQHKSQCRQQEHRQLSAHLRRCRNEEGAQQRTAGVAAVHQVHAAGAVGRVIADQNGAGVDNTALGNAHHKESHCQQDLYTGQAHDAVAHRIADGEQQHTGLHAQYTGQHTDEQACQQITHTHK